MKAVIFEKYGTPKVLKLKELEKPIPNENQILVKIKSTAVNSADWRLRKAEPFMVRLFFGLFKPKKKILGVVLSGIIEKTGKDVNQFKVGDEVFGLTDTHMGTYAQYICLPEKTALAAKPNNINFDEAAAIPFGAHTALFFLRKAKIKKGQKILIYGASGAVGSAAVQLAKYYGAEVTGVCSTQNTDMVKSMGADKVLDYTKEDMATIKEKYDIAFETVNKASLKKIANLLNKNGTLILGAAMGKESLFGAWISLTQGKKIIMGMAKASANDMDILKNIIEENKLKAFIDKTYPLELITDAHTYVEKGHKKGNVVINIQ